jgi:hypothetical protein
MFKQFQSIPWYIRAPLGAIVFVGAMYLLMRLWVGSAIEDAIDSSPENITYDSIFLRWSGDFGIEGVKGSHPLPDGSEKAYTADRMVVHTPGLLWLARIGWAGKSDELPDDFGVTIENARLVDDSDSSTGNWANLPFDAVGCGKRELTRGDMAEMGMGDLKRNITMRLTRLDDHASTFRMAIDTPGVGGTEAEMEIGIERPLEWEQGPQGLIGAPIKSGSTTFTDHGFIAARNAWCGKRAGLGPDAFVAHHMQKLQRHLAEKGMTLGVGALERYKDWVAKGGELKIVTVGDTRLTLGDFSGPERIAKMSAVRLGIRHDGGPLANFEMGTQPKIAAEQFGEEAPVPATTAVAAPAVDGTTVAAAPTAASTTPAPATPAAAPQADTLYNRTRSANLSGTDTVTRGGVVATGDTMPYAALEKHIGERVQIKTKMGSLRTGTVLSSNAYQTNLKLDAEDGGFNLNVFADTVAEVRLVAASN